MKNLVLRIKMFMLLMLFMAAPLFLYAQDGGTDETNWAVIVISALVLVAEVVARAIPNPKVTGIIGLVINLLKNVSDYLNREK